MRSTAFRTAIIGTILASGAPQANAATLRVPGEYASIQEGIDAALPGDTVLVAAGTYSGVGFEEISYGGKSVVVRSQHGAAHTILDVDGGGGVTFSDGETRDAMLEGFTITNAGFFDGVGAGIWCTAGACPTIRGCLVAHNQIIGLVQGRGAGIACTGGACPLLESCTFTGNYAYDDTPPVPRGGGIWCYHASAALVRCIFWGNCYGDVVAHDASSSITLTCCAVDPEGIGGYGEIEFVGENVFEDPLFCAPQPCGRRLAEPWEYRLRAGSPCLPDVSPCGELIGALPVGCPPASLPERESEWGGRDRVRLELACPSLSTGALSVELGLAREGRVALSVIDVRGGLCASLLDTPLPVGVSRFTWMADGRGLGRLDSGVYYLRLETGYAAAVRKFLVVR